MSLRPKTFAEAMERARRYERRRKAKRARVRRHTQLTQADVFRRIWNSRPHRCQVCDRPVKTPRPRNFSHVLPKGTYPEHKLDEQNILIECAACHDRWHDSTREALVRGDHGHADGWRWKFGLFDHLKRRAYA